MFVRFWKTTRWFFSCSANATCRDHARNIQKCLVKHSCLLFFRCFLSAFVARKALGRSLVLLFPAAVSWWFHRVLLWQSRIRSLFSPGSAMTFEFPPGWRKSRENSFFPLPEPTAPHGRPLLWAQWPQRQVKVTRDCCYNLQESSQVDNPSFFGRDSLPFSSPGTDLGEPPTMFCWEEWRWQWQVMGMLCGGSQMWQEKEMLNQNLISFSMGPSSTL